MVSPEQTRDAWDRFAGGYNTHITPFSMRVGEDALRRLGLGAGVRFLDVAAGGGALSIPAARMGAQVLAADFSPVMVERLNERARQEKLPNLEARVMDGLALELEDDTYDAAGSQLGIMLFPDRQQGLRELARVTKPGGRAMMVVFGPPPNVEILSWFMAAVRAAIPDFSPPPNSPLFSLQDPEKLRGEMTEAGLKDVRVETVIHTLEVGSGAEHWDMLTSAAPPIAALASRLTEDQRATVRQALDGMVRKRSPQGPAALKMEFHVAVGTK